MIIAILLWLLFGALVGWLAGLIMKSGNTLMWNIILGIIGSIVGGFIASLLGLGRFAGGFSFSIGNIIISVLGACLVIFIARMIKKR